ncbi:neural cell adhesion molecule 2 isoform X1 [Contarinia nasturtii]|uniref:neural cell adhesion molecule 2 isoform X1 n=1 Tax=Contarinia nasturtii TaxID=265458 RepID=UPI0012D37848|nr:neural cell adhesion molecule 2 isoform X1 [Contarinia nasturtii]
MAYVNVRCLRQQRISTQIMFANNLVKTVSNSIIQWFIYSCILSLLLNTNCDLTKVHAAYSEADDLLNELDRPIPITSVRGVLGRQAMLPCDIDPLEKGDVVFMVLWYREGDNEPLYHFDVRGRPIGQAKLWSSPTVFGSRAFFSTANRPAQLKVDSIQLADEGMYRCRVDFRNSPTRSLKINLTVIVPPDRPIIYEAKRREKAKNVEAYNEGSDVLLVCEVTGGRPRPNVTWYLDNTVIDESFEQRPEGVTVNHLSYPNIGRQHVNARFVCIASNTNLMPPNSKVLVIDVNLKPAAVHILAKRTFVSADKTYDIECKSSGSKPAAVITWWRGTKQIKRPVRNFSENPDNQSLSVLTFTPSIDDDGKHLSCRAANPYIENSIIEDKWFLVVHYMPVVTLKMGPSLNPDDIKEGDGVYFECTVRSNPKPYKMAWYHDGVELHHNVTAGIILTDQSLVLQSVTRASAGDYTCLAANTEGKGTSNPVTLRVRYAPVCGSTHEELLGALKHETLTLKCEVDASPPADSFHWTFNSSGEPTDLPARLHSSETGFSRLNYTPTNDLDYGTISCWGRNAIGVQKSPCIFQIVAAGRPFPMQNCSVSNQSSDSLQVECEPGFDGGLPQQFLLELVEMPALRLARNLSLQRSPVAFYIDNLEPGSSYRIILFAVNAKGRSEPTIIDDITFKGVAKYTGQSNLSSIPISPVLAGLTLTAAILFAVVCIVLGAIYRRQSNRNAEENIKSAKHTQLPVVPADCQLEATQQHTRTVTVPSCGVSTPMINNCTSVNNDSRHHQLISDQEPPDGDETDPDVIPNQYERRPLKSSAQVPLFRSPSARLVQHDKLLADDTYRGSDGSIVCSLGGMNNKEVHHYTFQPSKQISYATLSRGNKSVTTCSPVAAQPAIQLPMGVSLLSPTNHQSLVTSSLSEYRFRPEIVTTSNRIQESCI